MKKIFFLICVSFLLIGFTPALAADSGCSGFESQFNFLGSAEKVNVDLSTGLPKVCTAGSAISWITNLALGFAGVIAVVFIIFGGYTYLTSAGNEEAAEKGRKVLINAIIGLIIIILSGAIIRIVVNTLDSGGPSGSQQGTGAGGGGGGTPPAGGGTPPAGGGTPPAGGGGADTSVLDGSAVFSPVGSNISASLIIPKANKSAILAACGGIQDVTSNNTALIVKIDGQEVGKAGISSNPTSYAATYVIPANKLPASGCIQAFVCDYQVSEYPYPDGSGACGN